MDPSPSIDGYPESMITLEQKVIPKVPAQNLREVKSALGNKYKGRVHFVTVLGMYLVCPECYEYFDKVLQIPSAWQHSMGTSNLLIHKYYLQSPNNKPNKI